MRKLIAEIRRRRVISAAVYYVVSAWLVLQVADILLPAWGVSARTIQLIVYAALLGFPLALLFGWRYDLGRGGITRTPSANAAAGGAAASRLGIGDFMLLALMSLTFLAIGIWLLDRMPGDAPLAPSGPPNSMAVLAFESRDSGGQHAMDFTDRLITALIAIEGLKVTGRESSLYFADRSVPLEQIARTLEVRHVLRGAVTGGAAERTANVQLLRLPEEDVIWAETFNETPQHLNRLVGAISEQVARNLRVSVADGAARGVAADIVDDPEIRSLLQLAQSAYLANDVDRAIAQVEQVLARDPNIAKAHVKRATYYLLSFSSRGVPDIETVRTVARDSLDAAEALGAGGADYHYARGLQAQREIWIDGGTAAWHKQLEDSFRRVIALNPSDAQPYVSFASRRNPAVFT